MPRKKKEVSKKEKKSKIPGQITAVTVIYYVAMVFYAFFGVIAFILGIALLGGGAAGLAGVIGSDPDLSVSLGSVLSILGPVFLIFGIILIGLGVLYFFVARGIYKGKNWARVVAIILSTIGFVISLVSLVTGDGLSFLFLVISGYIFYVLVFDNVSKKYFFN